MEADQTQVLPSEAPDASLTPGAENAASSASPPSPTDSSVDMDVVIRQMAGSRSVPISQPDSQAAADAAPADGDAPNGAQPTDGSGQPAPQKPRLSKVELAEQRAAELAAENTRLQQALEAANPPPPDASEEARKAHLERERRFRDLNARPDDDPIFNEGDNYGWLQDEKRRRAVAPELQQQYEAVLQEDIAANRRAFEDAWNGIKTDLSTTLTLPGVTDEVRTRLLQAPLSEQIRTHRQLERRIVQAEMADEIARLRKDNERLQNEAMASTRAPIEGGRSGSPTLFDIDDWIRNQSGVRAR